LPRFLKKKNDPGSALLPADGDKGGNESNVQGSLLDLMDAAPSVVPAIEEVEKNNENHGNDNGSLLNTFVEAEQETRLRNAAWKISQLEQHVFPAEPVVESPSMGAKPRRSSEEQLDLLAEKLASVRSKIQETMPDTVGDAGAVPADSVMVQSSRYGQAPSSPFSFENVLGAVLRSWKWIVLGGIAGAGLAAVYALSLPNKYESVAEILIEPRGLRVLDNSVAPNELNSEATVAYAESQVSIIRSLSVLDPVIQDLELVKDPEFNGQEKPATGIIGYLGGLLRKKALSSNRLELAREYLQENLEVSRVNQTFAIMIGVSTESAKKSAKIANAIARSYIADESGASSSAAKNASEDLVGRLGALRTLVRKSEESVETYKLENDLVVAGGQLVSEAQLARLNDQLAIAQVQTGETRTRAKQAKGADLGDVISGSLPSSLASNSVNQLRVEYARANIRSKTLAVKLGSRHPQRIAIAAELSSLRTSIRGEIKRMIASAQEDYKTAQARQIDLLNQIEELKSVTSKSSSALVTLREMEREVLANRKVYEAFLQRSREIKELENIRSESARLISVAALPLEKKGPNRKLIVASGAVLGGGFGGFLGMLPFVFAGLRQIAGISRRDVEKDTDVGDLYSTNPGVSSTVYSNWDRRPA